MSVPRITASITGLLTITDRVDEHAQGSIAEAHLVATGDAQAGRLRRQWLGE